MAPTLAVLGLFFSSVQRVTSTFCALMHIYQLLPYVLSTSFSTHPRPLTWDKKPFQSRRVHFFRHYETFLIFSALWDWFFSEFFLFLPSIFDILQQNGCSKNSEASPFYIFRHYATYRKLQKNSGKKSDFFSQFLVFWELLLSSVVQKVVFVFLSLRYGADLGRSRLVSRYCETFFFFNLTEQRFYSQNYHNLLLIWIFLGTFSFPLSLKVTIVFYWSPRSLF